MFSPATLHIFPTYADAAEFIRQHEVETNFRYVAYSSSKKNFGFTDIYEDRHRIYFHDDDKPFTGVPFIIVNRLHMDCHYGKDRDLATKTKQRRKKLVTEMLDEMPPPLNDDTKKRGLEYRSKKVNCPAAVKLKEIVEFPNYRIINDTVRKRKEISSKIRLKLSDREGSLHIIRHIIVRIPCSSVHQNHPVKEKVSKMQKITDEEITNPEPTLYDENDLYLLESTVNDAVDSNTESVVAAGPSGNTVRNKLNDILSLSHYLNEQPSILEFLYDELLQLEKKLVERMPDR